MQGTKSLTFSMLDWGCQIFQGTGECQKELFIKQSMRRLNDQRLSFVYSFAVIYLHTHFSKALILGKFGKVIFCCTKILGYKTHPEF